MASARLFNQAPKITSRAPTTAPGWRNLLARTIARATELGDRRLNGLLKAQQEDKSEQILRLHGIISEACVLREFPEPMPKR